MKHKYILLASLFIMAVFESKGAGVPAEEVSVRIKKTATPTDYFNWSRCHENARKNSRRVCSSRYTIEVLIDSTLRKTFFSMVMEWGNQALKGVGYICKGIGLICCVWKNSCRPHLKMV